MALAGDHILVRMNDAGGTPREFIQGEITAIDLPVSVDQSEETGFGDDVHHMINGQQQASVTIRGLLTTGPNGTHTVLSEVYQRGKPVPLEVEIGNQGTPSKGDPKYRGTFYVERYQPVIESGKAIQFELQLRPAGAAAPVWMEVDKLEISTFMQTVGDELVTNGGFDTDTAWFKEAGWTIVGGVATHAPGVGSSIYQTAALIEEVFYELRHEAQIASGEMGIGLGVTGGGGMSHSVSGVFQEVGQHRSSVPIVLVGGSQSCTADNVSVRKIMPNPAWTMPDADGTQTLVFAVPVSPLAGQRIEMLYRRQSNGSYWAASIVRNQTNTDWDFQLNSVIGAYRTNRISVMNIGAVDAVRVVTHGNTHTAYTGAGGVFTQRGSTVDVDYLTTERGITTVYSSMFTPLLLTSE